MPSRFKAPVVLGASLLIPGGAAARGSLAAARFGGRAAPKILSGAGKFAAKRPFFTAFGLPTLVGALVSSRKVRKALDPRETFKRGKGLGELIEDPSSLKGIAGGFKDNGGISLGGFFKGAGLAGGLLGLGALGIGLARRAKRRAGERIIELPGAIASIPGGAGSLTPPFALQGEGITPPGAVIEPEPEPKPPESLAAMPISKPQNINIKVSPQIHNVIQNQIIRQKVK